MTAPIQYFKKQTLYNHFSPSVYKPDKISNENTFPTVKLSEQEFINKK